MKKVYLKLRRRLRQILAEIAAAYYAKKNRFQRAANLFEFSGVSTRNPLVGFNSHYLYGLSLFRSDKNLVLAQKLIEGSIRPKEFSVKESMLLADVYFKRGMLNEAEQLLLSINGRDERSGDVHFLLGMVYHKKGEWVFAGEQLSLAKEKKPDNPLLLRSLGYAQFNTNQFVDAAHNYQKAFSLYERNGKKMQSVYCAYRAAWSVELSGDRELYRQINVAALYESAVRNDIEHKSDIYGVGALHELYDRRDEAITAYTRAIEDGTYITRKILLRRARLLSEAQRKEEALSDISASIAIAPSVEAYSMQGEIQFSDGNYIEAELSFNLAIKRSGNPSTQLMDWYIRSLNKNGRKEEIERVQALRSAIEYELDGGAVVNTAQYYILFSDKEPVDDKVIVYESFHGKSFGENPGVLCRHLVCGVGYEQYTHVVVLNDEEKMPPDLRSNPNVVTVRRDSVLYAYYLATAKYLINNTTFPEYFIRRPEQKYLNTWHGVAWKTLGRDMKAGLSEMANSQRNLIQSTHIITPNAHMEKVLLDRYNIRDLYTGGVAHIGYPRIDETIAMTEEDKQSLKYRLGYGDEEKVVLYAPTWRGTNKGARALDQSAIIRNIKSIERSTGARVIYRGHHIDNDEQRISKLHHYEAPEFISTNSLLAISDILVTDYSSVAFDMISAKKPVVYYLPDYTEYKNERGLYFSKDELPGAVVTDASKLPQAVSEELRTYDVSNYTKFIETYCPYDDGKSTQRVIEFFFNDSKEYVVEHLTSEKETLLLYAGGFRVNGITTSSINLTNSIDKSRYNVYLLCNMDLIESGQERLEQMSRLDDNVGIIVRTTKPLQALRDEQRSMRRRRSLLSLSVHELEMYERVYKREFRRTVSDANIKGLINIEGYSEYEAALFGINRGTESEIRSAIYIHNDIYGEYKNRFRSLARVFLTYSYYNKLVSVSKETSQLNRRNLTKYFNIKDEGRFTYIDNVHDKGMVIERSRESISDEDKTIYEGDGKVFLTIGRLSPEKDHEKLIKAFHKVDRKENSKLIIIGYGPQEARLRYLIDELGVKNIYLLGARSNPYPLLRRADCFVLPSNYEGQPVVLFEALMLGKPIIATDIIANRGVLGDSNFGVLCDNTIEALSDSIQGYIDSAERYNKKPLDIDKYNDTAMQRFYKQVLGRSE